MTWKDYIKVTQKPNYQKGTRIGKAALKKFARGLNIRLGFWKMDTTTKMMTASMMLYKWLAEIKEFEPDADESTNVRICTFYVTKHKFLRCDCNITGHYSFVINHLVREFTKALSVLQKIQKQLARAKFRKARHYNSPVIGA